ncbi:hypothetical protein [Bradyrhizobium sp. WSM2254]|uniref:hypothetical protein n=1 Tax=Bradyrhizobium sp. WSM2254 TaxID=1188263 RepID=UPI0007C56B64|nr:hypothetical protein [Bradyrhizobium sp. WSM2254]
MKKFICEQNIAHFRKLLEDAPDSIQRRTLEKLLASQLRELAVLDAASVGADAPSAPGADNRSTLRGSGRSFSRTSKPRHILICYSIPDPGCRSST